MCLQPTSSNASFSSLESLDVCFLVCVTQCNLITVVSAVLVMLSFYHSNEYNRKRALLYKNLGGWCDRKIIKCFLSL